jgi:hypothetical protein
MATNGGIKPGLNPSNKDDSGYNNLGMVEYEIDAAYAFNIGMGSIVKRDAAGEIVLGAAADSDAALGVARGFSYVRPSDGEPVEAKYYPGTLNPTENAKCRILASPRATFLTRGNADISAVAPTQIYAMEASSVEPATGHEQALVDIAGGVTLGNDSIDVEIVKVHDVDNRILEVRLVNSELDR